MNLEGHTGLPRVLLAGSYLKSTDPDGHCVGCKEQESSAFEAWNSFPGKGEDTPCTCGWMTNSIETKLPVSGFVFQVQISSNGTPSIWIKKVNSFYGYLHEVEKSKFGQMEIPTYKYKDGSWSGSVSPEIKEHIEKTISKKDSTFYEKVSKAEYPGFAYYCEYAFGSRTEDEQRGEQILRNFIYS